VRITFLVPGRGLVGGIKVMGEYAGRLRARGHDVHIVYRRSARNFKRWLQSLVTRRVPDALDESGCPLAGVREFTADAVPDADVIVTTGLRAVSAATDLPREKGLVVELVQGTVHMEESPDEAARVMALPALRVAVSDPLAAWLRERYGVEAVVIPNGVDHDRFHNTDRQFRTPRSVGMIYVAGEMKGAADGFEAMRLVREKWPEVRLVLYGAKRPREALPRSDVTVRPKPSRLRQIYSSCEVWLAPSRSEGFGLPVLEAMACGAVPVATRTMGHEYLIEDEVSGFLVPVADPAAMARRISLLLEDESVLRSLSEAATERSHAFDWDRSTDRLEALLKEWTA
jgi:glycosyltransferase involved in cell wall biosynthesis